MAQKRQDFYKTHLIDNNKELDYLDTTVHEFYPEKTILWRVPAWAENRLDLVSYAHYRTVALWWLIALVNDIENPYEDVVVGLELQIPNISEYYRFFNANSVLDEIEDEGFDTRKIEV